MIMHQIGSDSTQVAIDGVLISALELSERLSPSIEKSQEYVLSQISHHFAGPIDVRGSVVLRFDSKPTIDRKPDAAFEAGHEL